MKDNLFNKKQLKKIILGLVIIVLAIMYSKTYVKYNIYNPKIDNSKWLQINSLKDNHIKQKFIAKENSIDGIQLFLSIGSVEEDALLYYTILDSNKNMLTESKVYQKDITPGRFNKLLFENKVQVKKGKTYYIELFQKSKNENSFLISYMTPRASIGHTFYNSENETDGTIIVRSLTYRFSIETFIVFLVFSFVVIYFLRMIFYLFRQ